MENKHSLEELRKKAHSLNCELFEEEYSPKEIEIVGYYLNRIAATYMSYFTHKEYDKTIRTENITEKNELYSRK